MPLAGVVSVASGASPPVPLAQWMQTSGPQSGEAPDSGTVQALPRGSTESEGRARTAWAVLRSLGARPSSRTARSRRIIVASAPLGATGPYAAGNVAGWNSAWARSSASLAGEIRPDASARDKPSGCVGSVSAGTVWTCEEAPAVGMVAH